MRQAVKTTLKLFEVRVNSVSRVEVEAANDLKLAVTARQEEVQRIIEAKKQEFEAEKNRQEQLLQVKLRQVEEQRQAAEERAAAAERLLREQEAAREALAVQHAAALQAENDLLQIAVVEESAPHISLQPESEVESKASLSGAIPERPVVAEEPEPIHVEAEVEPIEVEPIEVMPEPEVEAVQAYAQVVEAEPAPVTSSFDAYDSYETEEPKKSFPVAMIAGVAVALIVIIGGLWAAGIFGSSTPPAAAPQPAAAVPAEVPAQTEAVVPELQPENTQQAFADDPQPVQDPAAEPAETAGKPAVAATPKPKKPVAEPTKAKVEPKKVTVDDLIGDN
jgi:hypothetical protein